jgi:hypothetical protein
MTLKVTLLETVTIHGQSTNTVSTTLMESVLVVGGFSKGIATNYLETVYIDMDPLYVAPTEGSTKKRRASSLMIY